MVNTSVTGIPLSSNDISSLTQLLAIPLQYYCDHQSPFKKDYQKQLNTIVGLGFTAVLVDNSLVSIYQPHLERFIAHLRGEGTNNFHNLAFAAANLVDAAVYLASF